MKLWRPPTKTRWWIAFASASTIYPFAAISLGVLAIQTGFPQLFYPALFIAPLPACYLILVSKLHIVVRLVLTAAMFALVLFALMPRTMCGDDEPEPDLQRSAQQTTRARECT